ncbi:MAG: hypothetical protein ABUT20_31690 [Bacteroidota bacterium]
MMKKLSRLSFIQQAGMGVSYAVLGQTLHLLVSRQKWIVFYIMAEN